MQAPPLLTSALVTYWIRCNRAFPGCQLSIELIEDIADASADKAERYFVEKRWRVVEGEVVCGKCFEAVNAPAP